MEKQTMKNKMGMGLINVSPYVDLPKKIESYDGRAYILTVQLLQGGSGFVASYDCVFHDDEYAQAETLHEAKRKLAIKINGMIQRRSIKRISQPEEHWGVFSKKCQGLTKEEAIRLLLKTFENYDKAVEYQNKFNGRIIYLTCERK